MNAHQPCAAVTSALAIALSAGLPALAQVQPAAGMLRWPAVSRTQICFSYANDLWLVPKQGGLASRLASPAGVESFPRFSPDGATIAFVGHYDGVRDVYTLPTGGGVASRVTHHPTAETVAGWTDDGRILFIANGFAGLARQTQLFTIPPAGGLPERVGVPYAGFGSISPDGQWLAYTPHSTDNRTWKRYRGGMATDVWLFNLRDKTSRRASTWEGTDTLPMWVPGGDGRTVYFLSDRGPEHRLNVWAYSLPDAASTQITTFADDDVRWPSIGPGDAGRGEIVFQLGAKLMLLDLSTRQSREVRVTVPGDRPRVRARDVDASGNVASATLAPGAKRVAVEARGDVWSVPAKEGVVRNLTRTSGTAERDPAWSPDGKWIAYFSDASGEYELWVRPSDAKPPEKKDDKKDEKKDASKEGLDAGAKSPPGESATPVPEAAAPTPEPRKLTSLGAGFRFSPVWSPDSKRLAFTDQNGRLFVTTLESGETKEFDKDPWMGQPTPAWSADSRWITYVRADEGTSNGVVHIGNVETGEKHAVTGAMFSAGDACFDRKGDFLFFRSQRAVRDPLYSDIDSSFVYTGTDTILMVPLRADVKNPWAPKSDEETLKEDKKPADGKDGRKDDKKDDAKKDDAPKDDKKPDGPSETAKADDGLSGTWTGTASVKAGENPQAVPFSLILSMSGGTIDGTATSAMGGGPISNATFDKATGEFRCSIKIGDGFANLTGTVKGDSMEGTFAAGNASGTFTLTRTAKGGDSKDGGKTDAKSAGDEPAKEVKIDFDGFERRAMPLPVAVGSFGNLAVADGEKLIYVRAAARGSSEAPTIKVFEYAADEREEKAVTTGGGFELSADGKKLLAFRGGSDIAIADASAGGGKVQSVAVSGLRTRVDPRAEWEQIFADAWRIMRDYFYEPTMHGVDWAKLRTHYGSMLADASSREDVNWIIAEMISELNIGHAYLGNPGDIENVAGSPAAVLGCDFELAQGAFRIAAIYEGAAWDSDARGPLSQPGVNAKVGDFLLAVDGVPLDATRDPWAALLGKAGRTVALTLSAKPTIDAGAREVLVKPLGSDQDLRYRAWIEKNRAYVAEKTGGKVGYVYVPNTGVDGQNDLFRQFYGQRALSAMIIDERWNGGGQIPTRFIELLNRPVTNYWARRDGVDWTWPPDSHQGPICMLANGLAGSGGDMFPWLFKHNKLGPVIGTRTWGGLVGISGNPGFVDGGSITVPTFGFYEADGTWGVEGHGVDPDFEVIDDPALMASGGDPQLDFAINHMLEQIRTRPYTPPKRPQSPNRSGMGLPASDR